MNLPHSSIYQALGTHQSIALTDLFAELDWGRLPIDPIKVCREFLALPLKGNLIAISEELDLTGWKGVASEWELWPRSTNCQIRLDRKFVLNVLSETLGGKPDDTHFSCRNMSGTEKEIIENLTQEIIEMVNNAYQNERLNEQNEYAAGRLAHLVWTVAGKNGLGKIAISLPIERILSNNELIEKIAVRNEEDCTDVTIRLSLLVGSSKMTLSDLANLETEDFVLLENSDRNCFQILGMEGLDYAIPVIAGSQPKNAKWHKINLSDAQDEPMNKAFSNDMLSNFPVEVKAEFRDVKVTLKDLFALQSGWVLPIDQVAENELFLTSQGKTIAKGELVVTGDKFGILVKEVYLNNPV
jgi:flagellar motor switch/type III secretory pathway protein FliN